MIELELTDALGNRKVIIPQPWCILFLELAFSPMILSSLLRDDIGLFRQIALRSSLARYQALESQHSMGFFLWCGSMGGTGQWIHGLPPQSLKVQSSL